MNICAYTACNASYLDKLNMMIDSFCLYNPTIPMHILCCHKNMKVHKYNNIILHDASMTYQKEFDKNKKPSYACKKIKSLFHKFINIIEYDTIIYTDCDVLFYQNISPLYEDKNLSENIYFSHDGHKERPDTKNIDKICTGFFIFNPNQFQDLLEEWSLSIDKISLTRPKYLDQPAMKAVVSDKYEDKLSIISLEEISMKFKRQNVIATHYIRNYIHRMVKDYSFFIKEKL